MKLSKEKLFSVIEKSLLNARELYIDAKTLKENKRFERAYTCFQFCIEEIGKAGLTYQYLLDDDFSKAEKFLKEFRDHKSKTDASIGIDLMMLKMINDESLKKKILINTYVQGKKINYYNNHKNYSLYTSIIRDNVYLPSEVITVEKLEEIEFYATIRIQIAEPFYKIAVQEFDGTLKANKGMDKEK